VLCLRVPSADDRLRQPDLLQTLIERHPGDTAPSTSVRARQSSKTSQQVLFVDADPSSEAPDLLRGAGRAASRVRYAPLAPPELVRLGSVGRRVPVTVELAAR